MTLVTAYSSRNTAVLCSDRLIVRQDRSSQAVSGIHDTVSNKIILLVTFDSVIAIGYCGSAYIGGMTTDNWIVDTVAPGANLVGRHGAIGIFGGKPLCKLKLHQICNRLRYGLSQKAYGTRVTIMMAGFRIHRNKLLPLLIKFGASNRLSPDPNMKLRLAWPLRAKSDWIGANIDRDAVSLMRAFPAVFPDWDFEGIRNTMSHIIRKCAESDNTVGSDIMSLIIKPKRFYAKSNFEPTKARRSSQIVQDSSVDLEVSYSPWIITPLHFLAPGEQTGTPDSSGSWEVDGWYFEIADSSPGPGTPSNVGWHVAQARPRGI